MTALRVVLVALLSCVGCAKKPAPPHRTEPWLANPSASSSSVVNAPRTFHFLNDSVVRFSVPGRKGKVSGRFAVSEGSLTLDPGDLKSTTASIDVDLTKLSVNVDTLPEGAPFGDSSPSARGLQWLELGPGVAPERRNELRQARFELSSVEGLSANVLDLSATRAHVRVRATVVGTLLLHGFRAPIRTDVLLEPQKVAAGAPPRLSIRSAGALVIPLAQHDITARGASGIAEPLAAARAADWVGKNARVELELVAEGEIAAK
jgi:YceI-like domain